MKILGLVVALAACSKGGGSDVFKHENPAFKVTVPSDCKPPAHPSSDTDVSLWGKDETGESREVGLTWSPIGSPTDPIANFSRHGKEADLTKVLEQGDLPGGHGKFIKILRGKMTYEHAVLTSGTFGIECTTYSNLPTPPADYIDACKTLAAE